MSDREHLLTFSSTISALNPKPGSQPHAMNTFPQPAGAGAPSPANWIVVPRWKRVLDIAWILLALPVVAPLMLLIGLLIKIVSPGPVFFKQQRIGFRGRPFTCLKFRSMRPNADTTVHRNYLNELIRADVPMNKMDSRSDRRLIPLGPLLRASGLDELPQLINVLRGEMSIVGPRPCLGYEYEQYLPWHKERFNTLPGLTGLWQVSGKNHTTFTEMMHLDIFYARNKSLAMDLRIMLRTFSVLVLQVKESRAKSKGSGERGAGQPLRLLSLEEGDAERRSRETEEIRRQICGR